MRSNISAKITALTLALALAIVPALTPASAEQLDIAASQKRFDELYTKGNYPAALVEAHKLEAEVKARLGANDATYATALRNLANVHWKQGSYREAEGFYRRAWQSASRPSVRATGSWRRRSTAWASFLGIRAAMPMRKHTTNVR